MNKEEACRLLQIRQGADQREVKRQFAKLSRLYHPEEHPKEYERIYEAYRFLLGSLKDPTSMGASESQKSAFSKEQESFWGDSQAIFAEDKIEKNTSDLSFANINFVKEDVEEKEPDAKIDFGILEDRKESENDENKQASPYRTLFENIEEKHEERKEKNAFSFDNIKEVDLQRSREEMEKEERKEKRQLSFKKGPVVFFFLVNVLGLLINSDNHFSLLEWLGLFFGLSMSAFLLLFVFAYLRRKFSAWGSVFCMSFLMCLALFIIYMQIMDRVGEKVEEGLAVIIFLLLIVSIFSGLIALFRALLRRRKRS